MSKTSKILILSILFFLLIVVRAFLQPYFYDPLIDYFKFDYLQTSIPEINYTRYFLNILLRFLINTIISLAIISLLIEERKAVVFSIKFYVFSFITLSIILYILLKYNGEESKMLLFYVRRFLIQPLFLFILLPAFYYQKLKLKKVKHKKKSR